VTTLYMPTLDRWVRVGVLAIRENGLAVLRVLDGDREMFQVEVHVSKLRAS
jgi:hypothetical protein